MLGAVLHLPVHKQKHRIDWLGAVFMVTGTVMLLLVAVWEARGTLGIGTDRRSGCRWARGGGGIHLAGVAAP